jgi:hypothetical protein
VVLSKDKHLFFLSFLTVAGGIDGMLDDAQCRIASISPSGVAVVGVDQLPVLSLEGLALRMI